MTTAAHADPAFRGLLASIAGGRFEDAPVLADWLEDHGDGRADVVRHWRPRATCTVTPFWADDDRPPVTSFGDDPGEIVLPLPWHLPANMWTALAAIRTEGGQGPAEVFVFWPDGRVVESFVLAPGIGCERQLTVPVDFPDGIGLRLRGEAAVQARTWHDGLAATFALASPAQAWRQFLRLQFPVTA